MAIPNRKVSGDLYDSAYSDMQTKHEKMSGLFGQQATAASSSATATQGDITKDVQVSNPPEDSISDLSFSPIADYLAVASWDKKVRIYEINQDGTSQGKALFDHEGPVLSCAWNKVRAAVASF